MNLNTISLRALVGKIDRGVGLPLCLWGWEMLSGNCKLDLVTPIAARVLCHIHQAAILNLLFNGFWLKRFSTGDFASQLFLCYGLGLLHSVSGRHGSLLASMSFLLASSFARSLWWGAHSFALWRFLVDSRPGWTSTSNMGAGSPQGVGSQSIRVWIAFTLVPFWKLQAPSGAVCFSQTPWCSPTSPTYDQPNSAGPTEENLLK
jgi:hypothetical protein